MTLTMTYKRTNKNGKTKKVTLKTKQPIHIGCLDDFINRCIQLHIDIEPDTLIDSIIEKGHIC